MSTTSALRSLWDEPRAADPPPVGWPDWVLVGLVMTSALLEGTLTPDVTWRPVATVVALAIAPLLLWRRRHPLLGVVVGFGAATVLGWAGLLGGVSGVGLDTMIYLLVFGYALPRWGSGREIGIGLLVVALAATSSIAIDNPAPTELIGGVGVLAAAAAGGAALRYRTDNLRRTLAQVRTEERMGLARDLHDTVAHHVSAITVQAQAGQAMAAQRPEAAVEALAVIEAEASRTLAEMRDVVRVLRDGAPMRLSGHLAPQPRIADLRSLTRHEPLPTIHVELSSDLTGLSPHVEAGVYRMAQEALTNALRHARQASRVKISVVNQDGWVRLRVRDDGQPNPSGTPSPGFGLLGITERAQLLGGTVQAGPTPGGGWAVEADIPTAELSTTDLTATGLPLPDVAAQARQ